jgi:hypothetical protein
MQRDFCLLFVGFVAGGVAVYFRHRLLGAAKVLFGHYEAVATSQVKDVKADIRARMKALTE